MNYQSMHAKLSHSTYYIALTKPTQSSQSNNKMGYQIYYQHSIAVTFDHRGTIFTEYTVLKMMHKDAGGIMLSFPDGMV